MATENQPKLHVRILSPDETIWEGDAIAVSSENEAGPFDVLPEHANFITICIDAPLTVHLSEDDRREFSFDRFAMYNHDNNVAIYAEV